MLTLEDYDRKILRPSVLNWLGLPNTTEGSKILDLLIEIAIPNDNLKDEEYDDWEKHS